MSSCDVVALRAYDEETKIAMVESFICLFCLRSGLCVKSSCNDGVDALYLILWLQL